MIKPKLCVTCKKEPKEPRMAYCSECRRAHDRKLYALNGNPKARKSVKTWEHPDQRYKKATAEIMEEKLKPIREMETRVIEHAKQNKPGYRSLVTGLITSTYDLFYERGNSVTNEF